MACQEKIEIIAVMHVLTWRAKSMLAFLDMAIRAIAIPATAPVISLITMYNNPNPSGSGAFINV